METIVFLGDSITDSNRIESENGMGFGYVNEIAAHLHSQDISAKIINKGIDGFITEKLVKNLKEDCLGYSPDYVSILVGINDVGMIMNTAQSEDERIYMLEDCLRAYHQLLFDISHHTQARIITIEPFIFPHPQEYLNWLPWQQKLSKQIKKLARNYEAVFVPLQDLLNKKAEELGYNAITTDGIHLTVQGHSFLAQAVLDSFGL